MHGQTNIKITNVLLHTAMWKASRSTSCCKKQVSVTTISITNDKLRNIKHMLFLYTPGNARSSVHCVSSKVFKLFIFHYYIFPLKSCLQAYTFVTDCLYYTSYQCFDQLRSSSWDTVHAISVYNKWPHICDTTHMLFYTKTYITSTIFNKLSSEYLLSMLRVHKINWKRTQSFKRETY